MVDFHWTSFTLLLNKLSLEVNRMTDMKTVTDTDIMVLNILADYKWS